jgi:hypothetical protein
MFSSSGTARVTARGNGFRRCGVGCTTATKFEQADA